MFFMSCWTLSQLLDPMQIEVPLNFSIAVVTRNLISCQFNIFGAIISRP